VKAPLAAQRWTCDDPVWWRPPRAAAYRPLGPADLAEIRARFVAQGRLNLVA
jgi:fatty-acyl-CoA synthase